MATSPPGEMIDPARFQSILRRAVFTPWLLLVALAIILSGQIAWMVSSTHWVQHTDEVISQVRLIRRMLAQMVSGQRGYLLTGGVDYRQPYDSNIKEAARQLDKLIAMVSDNPPQVERARAIRSVYTDWTRDVAYEFALKDQGKDFLSYFLKAKSKGLADKLDALTDEFVRVEERLRDNRIRAAQQSTLSVFISTIGLTIGLGGLLAFLSKRELTALSNTYGGALAVMERQADALRESNENLERRVRERTAELEAANQELEAFSYSVSHDLRAPVRSIDGFSQALIEDYSEQLDSEAKGYLDRVRANSKRMGELIDDLLKLSRITRSELVRRPVDLSAMAREIAAKLQETQQDRHVEFEMAEGLIATGDPQLLRVVLENLLGNAWKFTAKKSDARIVFDGTQDTGRQVFVVRDNGAGFDMAYAGKLFGAFQRLHGMGEFEGSGIGLATVQRIVHRHGGRVWAEGEVDKGAAFYFTLP